MKVLIIGSGGREHALAWKISQSEILTKLFIAPGNAGTAELGENVNISVNDFESIKKFIIDSKIEMLVVGPEDPLVKGIYDYLKEIPALQNLMIIGPSKVGATLEGSKDWAKKFMVKHNIPTAKYQSFDSTNKEEAIEYLKSIKPPFVLKADGLAAGKGVLIIESLDEAVNEIEEMFNGKFGEAGNKVVIEEFLKGIEISVFVLTDGKNYITLPEAKDYKRIGKGDTGLNTGGMGAISPVPFATDDFMKKVEERIIAPTVKGLHSDNINYKGFIFFGLININDDPYVIEYNVRMGDPEAQVVIPRIKSDLLDIFEKLANDQLDSIELETSDETATTVVMVSGGYPETYEKGKEIFYKNEINDSIVFHAGTKLDGDKIVTNGGRVLAISSSGSNIKKALSKSYKSIESITFEKCYYRDDIGFDLDTN